MSNPTTDQNTVTKKEVIDALKGSPLEKSEKVLDLIVKLIGRYLGPENKRPLKTWCRVTGAECAMTAVAYFEKRLFAAETAWKDRNPAKEPSKKQAIMELMTNYTGRSGKPVAKPAPSPGKKNSVMDQTGDNAPGNRKASILHSGAGVEYFKVPEHQTPAGEIKVWRGHIYNDGDLVCQWDEFADKSPDIYYTGDSTARQTYMARAKTIDPAAQVTGE